jgi:hypothetical protein
MTLHPSHPADTTDVRSAQDAARRVSSLSSLSSLSPEAAGDDDTALRISHPRQPFYYGRGPSYTAAVRWIACEDEPGYLDPEEIVRESGVSVALVADVYGRFDQQVAEDVARFRRLAHEIAGQVV